MLRPEIVLIVLLSLLRKFQLEFYSVFALGFYEEISPHRNLKLIKLLLIIVPDEYVPD